MLANFVALAILIALAGLGVWAAFRVLKSKKALIKWGGLALLILPTLLLTLLSIFQAVGMYRLYMPRGNPVVELQIEGTTQQIERGEHIAHSICSGCHSLDKSLPLSGGKNISEEAGMPLGEITPPNLTPGGRIKDWTNGEIARAIREGTDPDGHMLVMMNSQNFRALGEDDLKSIIAYLRSQPTVQKESPAENLSPLAVMFGGAGLFPIRGLPSPEYPSQPAVGPTREYGEYIAGVYNCQECHGEDLTGGAGGLLPKGPNLRVVKVWTTAQFINTMRTGINPTGGELDPDQMPWEFVGRLNDDELTAIHSYLTSLE